MSIFVSYSHANGDWVHQHLVPVLRAAGADILIDLERFTAGKAVRGQMDGTQDLAKFQILVITDTYLKSDYCRHEMDRAIALDPDFSEGKIIPIRRDSADLPACLAPSKDLGREPIYVDLQNDKRIAPWDLLLKSCDLALTGTDAPNWISALDQTTKHLERHESVNIVVDSKIKWQTWQQQLVNTRFPNLGVVDLRKPGTIPREGLVTEILKATSGPLAKPVPPPPHDLPLLADNLCNGGPYHVLLSHFDLINAPERAHYTDELARSLRWSCMDDRSLVLVAQTRTPVANVFPANEFDSWPEFKTVELG